MNLPNFNSHFLNFFFPFFSDELSNFSSKIHNSYSPVDIFITNSLIAQWNFAHLFLLLLPVTHCSFSDFRWYIAIRQKKFECLQKYRKQEIACGSEKETWAAIRFLYSLAAERIHKWNRARDLITITHMRTRASQPI